jgi:hypothetical protein
VGINTTPLENGFQHPQAPIRVAGVMLKEIDLRLMKEDLR